MFISEIITGRRATAFQPRRVARPGGSALRFTCRLPASKTPTTNIVSHQSSAPPPPPLLGAVTVNAAVAELTFAPAGPVLRALAATVLV
jgi:hypothetical protein